MKTRTHIFIAIALIALPVLLRVVYFYQLPYLNFAVQKPDYASFVIPEPPTPSSKVESVVNPPDGKIVLIDNFHGNQFVADEIEPLVTAINAQGAQVEFDTGEKPLAMELKYASAYIIFAPASAYSSEEQRIIRQFVASGGKLLVFSDPTRALIYYDYSGNAVGSPDANFINPVIASFGLTVSNDYLYDLESNEGNFRNVKFTRFAENPLTKDLKMVVFYGAHSIHAEKGSPLVSGDDKTFSSLTDHGAGLTPLAISQDGQVLVAGDFSFISHPFDQVADNEQLLNHIAEFTVSGERSPELSNFPFVFQRPVNLVTTGKVELSYDILEPLASLQNTLKAINIPVNVRKTSGTESGDVIVLGTLQASEDLAAYIKPFSLDLKSDKLSIGVKGMGKVGNTSMGVLLFNHGPKSNTLILLASTLQDLPRLITLVASGDLSTCLLQDNIGFCNIVDPDATSSSSSGYSDYYYQDVTEVPSEAPFGVPVLPGTGTPGVETPTPTPSG